MLDPQLLSLAFAALGLIGQALNAWLKSQMRGDLAKLRAELLEKVHEEYVPREVFEVQLKRLEAKSS
jgi:hypothetical protein